MLMTTPRQTGNSWWGSRLVACVLGAILLTVPTMVVTSTTSAIAQQPVPAPSADSSQASDDPNEKSDQPNRPTAKTPATSTPRTAPGMEGKPEYFPAPSPAEKHILTELEQTTMDLEFQDTPLSEALSSISHDHGISVVLDRTALADEGLAIDEPVNCFVKGVRLKSALNLLLKPLQLTYLVADDVLMVTTLVNEDERIITRVYPVGDLCNETPDSFNELVQALTVPYLNSGGLGGGGFGGGGGGFGGGFGSEGLGGGAGVTPGFAGDGDRSITAVKASSCLVVRESPQGHARVLQLLRDLRQAKALQLGVNRKPGVNGPGTPAQATAGGGFF